MNRTGRPFEIEPTPLDVSVVIRARHVLGESPVWYTRTQELYLADIRGRQIHIFSPADAGHGTLDLPDWVTSLSPREKGGLVLTMRKTFAFYEPDTGRLEILADPEPDRPANRFNDSRCDRQGRLWAGTMAAQDWAAETGALYRLDPDLGITRMHDRIRCSNGTGWSPDGRTMYHTESFRYAIFAYDFDPGSGQIANRARSRCSSRAPGASRMALPSIAMGMCGAPSPSTDGLSATIRAARWTGSSNSPSLGARAVRSGDRISARSTSHPPPRR